MEFALVLIVVLKTVISRFFISIIEFPFRSFRLISFVLTMENLSRVIGLFLFVEVFLLQITFQH